MGLFLSQYRGEYDTKVCFKTFVFHLRNTQGRRQTICETQRSHTSHSKPMVQWPKGKICLLKGWILNIVLFRKAEAYYHWIWICYEIPQRIQKSLIFHHLGIDIMEFCHANCGCFSNIGIFILQALAEGLTEIFCDLVHPDAPHGSDCQGPNQRIGIFTVLQKNNHWQL